MKAVLLNKIGSYKDLTYSSIYVPTLRENEALVKVRYCGVNHLDLHIINGSRPGPKKFPHILGSEIVGMVEKMEGHSKTMKAGDTVSVYPWIFCGKCRQCRLGCENICDNGGTFGRTRWGGYAQYVTVPLKNLVKLPLLVSLGKVCAITLAGTTAYHLVQRANIPKNVPVLVTGASGGVGTAVIQLLKQKGCRVICTTSKKSKQYLLKKIGVNMVIPTQKIKAEIKKMYPHGMEYIIDIMGGSVWSTGVEILAKGGTLVFCATSLLELGQVNISSAFTRQVNILGSYGGTIKDWQAVLKLVEKKILQPQIDSVYPLKNALPALKKLDKQQAFGKILLEI